MALLVRFCKTLDQRFPASQECAFKQSLEPSFVVPMYTAAVASIAATLWSQWSLGGRVTDSVSLIIASKNICTVLLMLSIILALVLRRWIARRLGFIDLEYVSAVLVPIGLTIWSLGGKWYAAQLVGRDPRQFWGDWSGAGEINLVMKVIISTTFCCVLLPMRTHVSCAVSIFCISMFFVVTLTTSSPYPENVFVLMFYLCCSSGFLMIAGSRQESHLRKEWLAQRQIEKHVDISEKQRTGFAHLLDRLCDCLLQLGPNFEIMEPCPNLAAMLFIRNENQLQGTCFCDYIAVSEDRDSFVAAMDIISSEQGLSGVIAVRFRDGQSRQVKVHVFYTCFHDLDGSPYYIIGVVEAGARAEVAEPEVACTEPVEEVGLHDAMSNDALSRTTSRTTSSARLVPSEAEDETSHSESDMSLESISGSDFGDISVTIDDDCTIISCTPGFTALCGPIGDGLKLTEFVVDADRFSGFVQDHVNRFLFSKQFGDGDITVRTPSATSVGLEYVASDVAVNAISGQIDSLTAPFCTLRISFQDIHQRARRNRNNRNNRNSRRRHSTHRERAARSAMLENSMPSSSSFWRDLVEAMEGNIAGSRSSDGASNTPRNALTTIIAL